MPPASPEQSSNGQRSAISPSVLPSLRPGNTSSSINRATTTEDTKPLSLTSFPDRPDIDPSDPSAPVFVNDKVESRLEYVLAGAFDPFNRPRAKQEPRWVAHMDVRISRLPNQRRGNGDGQAGGTNNNDRPSNTSNEGLRQLMTEGFFWSFRKHLIRSFRPLTKAEMADSGFDPERVYGHTYYLTSVIPLRGIGKEPTLEWEMQAKIFEKLTGMNRDWEIVSYEYLIHTILAARAYNEEDELVYLFDHKNCSQPSLVKEIAFRYLVGLTLGHADERGPEDRPPSYPGSEEWWNGENTGRNFNLVLDPQMPGQRPKGFFPREIDAREALP